MSILLPIIIAFPAVAALVCVLAPPIIGDRTGALGAAAAGAAAGLAVVLTVVVVASGPVSAVIAASDGRAVAGLYADRLSVAMLLLVLGVSTVVQLFSSRYLSGDPRLPRLRGRGGTDDGRGRRGGERGHPERPRRRLADHRDRPPRAARPAG